MKLLTLRKNPNNELLVDILPNELCCQGVTTDSAETLLDVSLS